MQDATAKSPSVAPGCAKVIDRVEVDEAEVRIIGRNPVLEGLVLGGGAGALAGVTLVLVAGTAIAALPEPSARAAAPAAADPIYAAIKAAKLAASALYAQCDALDQREAMAKRTLGPRPWPLVQWRGRDIGRTEIEHAREEFLALPGADPELVEFEYQQAKTRCRLAQSARDKWERRAGTLALRRQVDTTRRRVWQLERKAARTVPTIIAGALAMLSRVNHEIASEQEADWHLTALRSVAKAMRGIGGTV